MPRHVRITIDITNPQNAVYDEPLPEGWDDWPEGRRDDYLTDVASEYLQYHAAAGASVVDDTPDPDDAAADVTTLAGAQARFPVGSIVRFGVGLRWKVTKVRDHDGRPAVSMVNPTNPNHGTTPSREHPIAPENIPPKSVPPGETRYPTSPTRP